MKLFHRYILSEILVNFTVSLLVLTGLLLTVRVLKLANLVINKGVSLSQVGMVFLTLIPTFLEFAVPLAALFAVMLAFARLSGDSEIVIMRASGTSLYQILRPVLIFGGFALILGLYISIFLKPLGFQQLSKTLFEIARTSSSANLESGVFQQLGKVTLYAEDVVAKEGKLRDVLIDDRRDEDSRKVITARTGSIESDPVEQVIIFALTNGEIHESSGQRYVVTRFHRNRLMLSVDDLHGNALESRRNRRPRELSPHELRDEMASLKVDLQALWTSEPGDQEAQLEEQRETLQARLRQLRIERSSRFALPVSIFLLAICAMPLGIHPPRSHKTWGVGLSLSIGLGLYLFYFALYSVGTAMAESGNLSVLLGTWLPNLTLGVLALFMIRKVGTESWQSLSEGIQDSMLNLYSYMERIFR